MRPPRAGTVHTLDLARPTRPGREKCSVKWVYRGGLRTAAFFASLQRERRSPVVRNVIYLPDGPCAPGAPSPTHISRGDSPGPCNNRTGKKKRAHTLSRDVKSYGFSVLDGTSACTYRAAITTRFLWICTYDPNSIYFPNRSPTRTPAIRTGFTKPGYAGLNLVTW